MPLTGITQQDLEQTRAGSVSLLQSASPCEPRLVDVGGPCSPCVLHSWIPQFLLTLFTRLPEL